jgi:hypothetical protein
MAKQMVSESEAEPVHGAV